MIKRLTGDNKEPIWVNLSLVLTIHQQNVAGHFPGTLLTMTGGVAIAVFETPEEVSALANAPEKPDPDLQTIIRTHRRPSTPCMRWRVTRYFEAGNGMPLYGLLKGILMAPPRRLPTYLA